MAYSLAFPPLSHKVDGPQCQHFQGQHISGWWVYELEIFEICGSYQILWEIIIFNSYNLGVFQIKYYKISYFPVGHKQQYRGATNVKDKAQLHFEHVESSTSVIKVKGKDAR